MATRYIIYEQFDVLQLLKLVLRNQFNLIQSK